jgi:hypothetical protein
MPYHFNYSDELIKVKQLINAANRKPDHLSAEKETSLHNLNAALELFLRKDSLSLPLLKKLIIQLNITSPNTLENDLDWHEALQNHVDKLLIDFNGIMDNRTLLTYLREQALNQPFESFVHTEVLRLESRLQENVAESELSEEFNQLGDRLLSMIQTGRYTYVQKHCLLNLGQLCKNRAFYQARRFQVRTPAISLPNEPVSPFYWNEERPPLHRLLQAVEFSIVYVSGGHGEGPGVGHSLLHLGDNKGYVHIDGLYNYPVYLSDEEFRDLYLDRWHKQVVAVQKVTLPDPTNAMRELVDLCQKRWFWGGLWHNCFDFCKQILQAGGASLEDIEGLSIPSHRLLNLAIRDFSPLDHKDWSPTNSVELSNPYFTLLKNNQIQDCIQGLTQQQLAEFIDYVIVHIGNVFILQKPLQKARILRELGGLESAQFERPSDSDNLIRTKLTLEKQLLDLDQTTAEVIVKVLIDKILLTNWQSGNTISLFLPGQDGPIRKQLPHNMARMLKLYQQFSNEPVMDYVALLNEISLTGYQAGLKNNGFMSWLRGRTAESKAFYQSFVDMVQTNAFFKQPRANVNTAQQQENDSDMTSSNEPS